MTKHGAAPYSRVLRFESLEDRRLLSITVNTLVDENNGIGVGNISLREAIAAAAPTDTINFAASLTSSGPTTILLTNGQLVISKNLTINGPGSGLLTIDAQNGSRIFDIAAGSENVDIGGLTLTHGKAPTGENGGAIRSQTSGILSVHDSTVSANHAGAGPTRGNRTGGSGGGIWSIGSLRIANSLISGNVAGVGGITTDGAFGGNGGSGGGIWSSGSLTVTGSTVFNNHSGEGGNGGLSQGDGGDGGGIFTAGGSVTVSDHSHIDLNISMRNGGGIALVNAGLTVTDSELNSNHAAAGGAIWNNSGIANLVHSGVSGNTANSHGGGLFSNGSLYLTNSTIYDNYAAVGAGIYCNAGLLKVSGSTISSNDATFSDGGGIWSISTNVMVTNSTISNNAATGSGGGIFKQGGTFAVAFSTITGNLADGGVDGTGHGGGIYMNDSGDLWNTIVAGNLSAFFTRDDVFGEATARYSLVGDSAGALILNIQGSQIGTAASPIDPLLGFLTYNGGLTSTYALRPGSPAIDRGDPAAVAGIGGVPQFDQRGSSFDRVIGGRINIGAYEGNSDPSVLLVDNPTDEADGDYSLGDVSLREAIALAASNTAIQTIEFDPSLAGESLLLTQGQLVIGHSIVINGLGENLLTINAQHVSRIFDIAPGTENVTISGLTLTGGQSPLAEAGGAIRSQTSGQLTIRDSTIFGNATGGGISGGSADELNGGSGGGIWCSGALTLVGTSVTGNSAGIGASATAVSNSGAGGYGGAIWTSGFLNMLDSVVKGNYAGAGGIGLSGDDPDPNPFANGGVGGAGGGIWCSGNASVKSSVISFNRAGDGGIDGNGGHGGPGGGIWISGSLDIQSSSVSGNLSGNHGRVDLTVQSARDSYGGGIYLGTAAATISGCSINGNSTGATGFGGGMFGSCPLTITESTISSNIANRGGGIFDIASVMIAESTITGNSVNDNHVVGDLFQILPPHGGGVYVNQLNINHTIIAKNTFFWADPNKAPIRDDALFSHAFAYYSIFGDIGSFASYVTDNGGNAIGTSASPVDPMLGPLAVNGGPTFLDGSRMLTQAPLPGGPAVDTGNPAVMAGSGGVPFYDQRSAPYVRIYNGRIDIGAIELQPIRVLGDYNHNGTVDAADYTVWRDTLGSTFNLAADGNANGMIDAGDYGVWIAHFGGVLPGAGSGAESVEQSEMIVDQQSAVGSSGSSMASSSVNEPTTESAPNSELPSVESGLYTPAGVLDLLKINGDPVGIATNLGTDSRPMNSWPIFAAGIRAESSIYLQIWPSSLSDGDLGVDQLPNSADQSVARERPNDLAAVIDLAFAQL